MRRKALFFDIDGTLALPGEAVSAAVTEAIRTARSRGHLAFLSTGRTEGSVPVWVKDIGFDGGIYSAGGRVVLGERELSCRPMPRELVEQVREVFHRHPGAPYVLECRERLFPGNTANLSQDGGDQAGLSTELRRVLLMLNQRTGGQEPRWAGEPVYKVAFFTANEAEMEALDRELTPLGKLVRFANLLPEAGMRSAEFTAPGIDKGKALQELCAACGIDPADSVAFGDSMNDAEMLTVAGIGVAMASAEAQVLALADRRCESCGEDGVAKELKRMGLC